MLDESARRAASLRSTPILAAAFAMVVAAHPSHASQSATPPAIAVELIDAAARHGEADRIRIVAEDIAAVLPSFREPILAYAAARTAALPASPAVSAQAPPQSPALETAAPRAGGQAASPGADAGLFAGWDGDVSFGASFASGNSDNVAVGGAFEAARETGRLTHHVNGYADFGEAEGVTNQRRWGAAYKLDLALGDGVYAYARGAYDEDEFSGFDYRLFAGAGLGYFLAKSEPFTLKVEGGPGYRYSPIDDGRDVDDEVAAYGAVDLDWLIREGLKLEQDVAVTWTEPTTTTESRTSLTTTLFGDFSAGFALNLRFETNPPPGRVRTDRVLRATLGYAF